MHDNIPVPFGCSGHRGGSATGHYGTLSLPYESIVGQDRGLRYAAMRPVQQAEQFASVVTCSPIAASASHGHIVRYRTSGGEAGSTQ